MRCLSIRQPWAWLICAGKKTIENRVWQTAYRGTIAIHASTTKSEVGRLKKALETDAFKADNFEYGSIIGFADIVDIQLYGREHEDDGFACGPYCFKLTNGRLLREPVSMMGKLNLFVLDESIATRIANAETYRVDLQGNSREAEIASSFGFLPNLIDNYTSTIEQLVGKIENESIYAMCTRMIELEPNGGEGHIQRCKLALQTGLIDNLAADTDCMLRAFPDDDEVASYGAEACVFLGKYAVAKSLLERLLTAQPEAPGHLFLYGQTLFELGDFAGSITQLQKALASGANELDSELCHVTLARAYHRIEQLDDAFEHIEKAKSYGSEIALTHAVAARIAMKQNRYADAKLEVAAALQLNPDYPNTLQMQEELKNLP